MSYHSSMTSKGQVTVPKRIRDALGLLPGHDVAFELDGDGNARILRMDGQAQIESKKADIRNRLKLAQELFRKSDTMSDSGMDGLTYQRWLRGDQFSE